MDKTTIFILVQGGIVQNIWSPTPEQLNVVLVDQDDDASLDEVMIHNPYQVESATSEEIAEWIVSWEDLREQLPNSDDDEDTPTGEDPEVECPQCHKSCRESEITFLNRGYCHDCLLINMGLKERED